jgi:hypothetical protein
MAIEIREGSLEELIAVNDLSEFVAPIEREVFESSLDGL